MPESAERLRYDPRKGPDQSAWLGAPEAKRTLAVRRWLERNEPIVPCCLPRNADEWREVEDQLATGRPRQTRELMERMLGAGVERMVAIWALAVTLGSPRYQQLETLAQDGGRPGSSDIQGLLGDWDAALLAAAFEASARSFGPAHETVIDHYHVRYDPEGSMSFAVAAGFCFGCAASPKFVRNHTLYGYMFGNEVIDETPAFLPVADAYRELFRFVSDAVFEQDDPIPQSVRPPAEPEGCFRGPFSDWCRGFLATRPVVAPGWEAHLAGHPALYSEYLEILDTLRFFAGPGEARQILEARPAWPGDLRSAASRVRSHLDGAVRRLFLLAHPV